MKPTKVIITIPLKGWSKHDDIEETCRALEGLIKGTIKLFDRAAGGGSPFDLERMTVQMPTLRRAPSKG